MCDWKKQVGKVSDREIARQFGVGATSVRRYRKSLGIDAWKEPVKPAPAELEPLLGVHTDHKLSRLLNYPKKHIKHVRRSKRIREPVREWGGNYKELAVVWTEETLALLGTMPDTDVAAVLGTTQFPVRKKRYALGIPAYKAPMPEITPEIEALFGKVSDAKIAESLGVSANFIRTKRLKFQNR